MILNFQEFTTILNASTKKSGNLWEVPRTTISQLNELIFTWPKIFNDKICILFRNPNRTTKPGWEIWLDVQLKNCDNKWRS